MVPNCLNKEDKSARRPPRCECDARRGHVRRRASPSAETCGILGPLARFAVRGLEMATGKNPLA
jgi:hypothetical protein